MTHTSHQCDFLIIGSGILGLGTARAFKKLKPNAKIIIIEKESDVALHTSGRNSGVLHAGIYYSSSSLKAKLCVQGNLLMKDLCKEKNLAINECGKLIVATKESEVPELNKLFNRAVDNGCTVELIDDSQARKIEPNIKHFGPVIYSPLTASVNPTEVCQALKTELSEDGVQFLFNTSFKKNSRSTVVETSRGTIEAGHVVNACGLYADRIANEFGFGLKYGILPFKGLYLQYSEDPNAIKTNIYPVPDPRFPFLGIHFNKTYNGIVKIGATAIPSLWREQYGIFDNFSLKDLTEIGVRETKLIISNSFNFRDLAIEEIKRFNPNYLATEALKLVNKLNPSGFTKYPTTGIRAQLIHLDSGELVQDFILEGDKYSTHILNAVSPGFTCGLSFGEYIAQSCISIQSIVTNK